jgi:hypothetical protein
VRRDRGAGGSRYGPCSGEICQVIEVESNLTTFCSRFAFSGAGEDAALTARSGCRASRSVLPGTVRRMAAPLPKNRAAIVGDR